MVGAVFAFAHVVQYVYTVLYDKWLVDATAMNQECNRSLLAE